MAHLPIARLDALCRAALEHVGADPVVVDVLARATCEAEARGKSDVGASHLVDYLRSVRDGRLDATAKPTCSRVAGAVVVAEARGGAAQVAFEVAYDELVGAARECGIGVLHVVRSYTAGELGYYTRRLAEDGFLTVAASNSPALMSFGGSPGAVMGTNPLSFACPVTGRGPLAVDQSSSATAFVTVRAAAAAGKPLPPGCAVDEHGAGTQDPAAALRGGLLPFGGHKGGNVALLVELLAVAAGSHWSVDAPRFDRGGESPGVGLFVLALDLGTVGANLPERLAAHLVRLASEHGVEVSRMGGSREPQLDVEVDDATIRRLDEFGSSPNHVAVTPSRS